MFGDIVRLKGVGYVEYLVLAFDFPANANELLWFLRNESTFGGSKRTTI